MDAEILIDDNSIDVIITDPPYGIDFKSNWNGGSHEKIANDKEPYIEWIEMAYSKLKTRED